MLFTVTPTKKSDRRVNMTKDLDADIQDTTAPVEEAKNTAPEGNADLLTRDIVSKIVDRERKKAFEKGREEAMAELQEQQSQQQAPAEQIQQGQQSLGGMQQMSPQDIQRMIAEHAPQALQEHMQQQRTQQTIDSFVSKMQAAEAKYPGLESKLDELDYSTLAPIVKMANDMENTGDIMKELIDNPEKMSNLILLSYTQPKLAFKKMADLSNSIKTNTEAMAQEKKAQDPMSQLKPSSSAGMDNSDMSVTDFRKMFR